MKPIDIPLFRINKLTSMYKMMDMDGGLYFSIKKDCVSNGYQIDVTYFYFFRKQCDIKLEKA